MCHSGFPFPCIQLLALELPNRPTKLTKQTTKEFRRGRPVQCFDFDMPYAAMVCREKTPGESVEASPTSMRSPRCVQLAVRNYSTLGLWWILMIFCGREDDIETLRQLSGFGCGCVWCVRVGGKAPEDAFLFTGQGCKVVVWLQHTL